MRSSSPPARDRRALRTRGVQTFPSGRTVSSLNLSAASRTGVRVSEQPGKQVTVRYAREGIAHVATVHLAAGPPQ
jgi:hypothetical protein